MTRAGWRYFACDECGRIWWETTRDRFSPSGEDCVCCNAWVRPSGTSEVPIVETDAHANVRRHEVRVLHDGNDEKFV